MSDIESFRDEVRGWLAANAPPALLGSRSGTFDGEWGGRRWNPTPDRRRWVEIMAERGWTAPTWPREYGGGGLSGEQARVLDAEIVRLGLPHPLVGFGLVMIGPTLLDLGTEAQKREHLPRIARGEIRWCQGYSEPGAGSDLASLRTRAVRDGEHFVVTGHKVWTSYADQSDAIFCLVRTNPDAKKQAGITFLLIDMDDPGVSVQPIRLISGSSPFCEVFLQDVRVPVANVVGQIDAGWAVAKHLLGYERTMVGDLFGASAGAGGALLETARRQLGLDGDGRLADPLARDAIARLEMEARAFAFTVQRSRDGARAGQKPGPESSILKVVGTELNQRRWALHVSLLGPDALLWDEVDDANPTRQWLRSRGNSIEGGTTEIQLNIIAKRVLGLPD